MKFGRFFNAPIVTVAQRSSVFELVSRWFSLIKLFVDYSHSNDLSRVGGGLVPPLYSPVLVSGDKPRRYGMEI
jgi:hypothetical protein